MDNSTGDTIAYEIRELNKTVEEQGERIVAAILAASVHSNTYGEKTRVEIFEKIVSEIRGW